MPSPVCPGCVRPAAKVNEEIRQLVEADGPWDADRYANLLVEWAEASRREHRPAA